MEKFYFCEYVKSLSVKMFLSEESVCLFVVATGCSCLWQPEADYQEAYNPTQHDANIPHRTLQAIETIWELNYKWEYKHKDQNKCHKYFKTKIRIKLFERVKITFTKFCDNKTEHLNIRNKYWINKKAYLSSDKNTRYKHKKYVWLIKKTTYIRFRRREFLVARFDLGKNWSVYFCACTVPALSIVSRCGQLNTARCCLQSTSLPPRHAAGWHTTHESHPHTHSPHYYWLVLAALHTIFLYTLLCFFYIYGVLYFNKSDKNQVILIIFLVLLKISILLFMFLLW